MRACALALLAFAPIVSAQDAAAPAADAAAGASVVDTLVRDLGVTQAQAQGAAGAVFGLAKTKLTADEFTKVAGAVPDMDTLLKAAPVADAKTSALDALTAKAATAGGGSSLGAVAGIATSLNKLGLKPDQIAKVAPTLIKAVQSKGGAEAASLLTNALK